MNKVKDMRTTLGKGNIMKEIKFKFFHFNISESKNEKAHLT